MHAARAVGLVRVRVPCPGQCAGIAQAPQCTGDLFVLRAVRRGREAGDDALCQVERKHEVADRPVAGQAQRAAPDPARLIALDLQGNVLLERSRSEGALQSVAGDLLVELLEAKELEEVTLLPLRVGNVELLAARSRPLAWKHERGEGHTLEFLRCDAPARSFGLGVDAGRVVFLC